MYEIVETRVSYPGGEVQGSGRVLAVLPYGSAGATRRVAVVTESTPFHPVDHSWPDQPADHGVIALGATALPVVDVHVLSVESATGDVRIGAAVSARRGDPGHVFAVAHVVDTSGSDISDWTGRIVSLEVDVERRLALSAAHTACHLVAYAFNESVGALWTKDAPRDSRGHRDFDTAALLDTRHHLGGSIDRYRLGRSLRRKGFNHPQLLADLDEYVGRANATLASWLASKADVSVTNAGDHFTAERTWRCAITPPAIMPCGGTHVPHLGKIAKIRLDAQYHDDTQQLTFTATTQLR